MADEDEQDPVTDEIDIYLAKTLTENIHLFQYPTRPAAITYDKTECLAARVKPKQQKVMLEMSLNTTGSSYCSSKGEQFAYQADNGVAKEKKFFKSDTMDKQVLLSSQGTMSTSQYAVGLLKDGEIHLTPLKGVIQLRPSFEYLDRGKDTKTNTNEDGDSHDEDEEKAKALSVRFAKKESEQAKAHRLSSYKYLEKQMSEEQWTDVKYYGSKEPKSLEEKDLLFCQDMNVEVLEFDPSASNYIGNLMPPTESGNEKNPKHLPQNTVSITNVKKLDLIDQVKCLLINAKLMSFSEMCSLVHPSPDKQAVLKCLQQFGVLVQGCWVVKSEFLYPKGKTSPFSTAVAESLCKGRDYILYKFTQSRSIQRHEVMSVVKLPMDDVNDIIKQVAKRNVTVGWEFKLPFDKDFVAKYSDVVKQQETLWNTKYRTLCDKLKIQREDVEIEDEEKASDQVKEEANHKMENLVPRDQVKKMDIDLPNGFCENKMEEDHEVSTPDQNKLFNRLVKFVKDKLNTSSLSLAEFKKLILLHQTAVSPGDILSSGVSDALLLKAIDRCGGEELDLKWPLTSQQFPCDLNSRRIFVLREVDTPLDKYRGVILDLFRGSFGIQRKTIMERTKHLLGSSPTSFEYTKIIQELGLERKGTSWYIRGTLAMTSTN